MMLQLSNNIKKIKLLHIIASSAIGGAERVLLTLLENIDRKKFDIILGKFTVQRKSVDLFWKEVEKLEVPIEPIRLRTSYDLLQMLDIYRIIKKYNPDIIHTHGYKTNILGFLFSKFFRIPIITTVHGLFSNNTKTDLFVRLSLPLLKHFDQIIAVSGQIKAELQTKKIPSRKMMIIRNVPPISIEGYSSNNNVFRDEIGIPPKAKVVGFVGRLERVKGCNQLMDALPIIFKGFPDFFMVIVGDGPERESLYDLVRKLGLSNRVYFCGFRDDIKNVFQSLDLYVLPSLDEGIPLAMLEAMFYGVPVVATRVGGIPEVIQDGVNGILVPPGNTEALAKSIVELLRNPDKRAKILVKAKETITKEYATKKWIEKIQNVYLEVTN